MEVTETVAIDHGLKKEEFSKICELLKRTPNITELAIFSAMWNEHCSYKSSRKHLKKLHTKGKQVIQGPGENAGIIDIDDELQQLMDMSITRIFDEYWENRFRFTVSVLPSHTEFVVFFYFSNC